ncbi:MAG: hypothetical protein MUO77_18280 [Anaerolineales bacterium]|nr:hypothetical protein [Anaerolineales bacterium]
MTVLVIFMMVCLSACGPDEIVPPDVGGASPQLVTPAVPPGAVFLDACTYMVSYPEAIPPLDSTGLVFSAEINPNVSVMIQARRRGTEEEGLTLDEISARIRKYYSSEAMAQEFHPFVIKNYLGDELTGLMGEFINAGGDRVRLLVVIQPDSFLMDMVADDVVYVITAQAPQDQWDQWVEQIDVFFQTFHPAMCGGV